MEVLKLLEDDSHYYGELGRQYLSNSDIITLLNDPKSFREEKPMSKAMLIGRYFHTKMLEPDKLDSEEYIPIDASSRNTKIYKEGLQYYERDLMMLQKEKEDIDKAILTMQSNLEMYDSIYAEENEFEVPTIMEIFGIAWKGKADIVGKNMLIDLKTTSNIKDFKYSARKYNYDSQAWLYQQFFGKPLIFYVIDKTSYELGIFEPSETFLEYGKEKVKRAVEIFRKFYGENAEENIDDYIIKEIL